MKLDTDQEKIVNSTDKNILVVAGAGSGKTRVLTERVKHLIDTGVTPCYIVCITFTNIAAQEMKARLMGVDGIEDAFIGTIHSFANTIYKSSGITYKILNSEIELKLYSNILNSPRGKRTFKKLSMERLIKYFEKRSLLERGKILESEVNSFFTRYEEEDFRNAEKIMLSICERENIITFDELIAKTREYYRSINGKVEYLLVDELQDVGNLEFSFIKGLNANNNFFVGDDWQSIYSFKGGDVNIFKELVKDNSFTKFFLNNNYRNTKEIVDIGNDIIAQVNDKVEKETVVKNKKAKGYVEVSTKEHLAVYLELIDNLKKYGDWFILVRSNKDLLDVAEQLKILNLPYITFKKAGMGYKQMQKLMNSNSIKLLTVHSAKGLENKNVILYGKFPLQKPSYIKDDEERKVMYVGITRAEETLIILN